MFAIDASSEFGQRVLTHLREEDVIWLTTTRPERAPQPSPVWFLWHEDHLLVCSQPNTPKVRNIAANPGVALNFNCTPQGSDVAIMTASAEIVKQMPPTEVMDKYFTKYARGIERLGSTPEKFIKSYSVPIRITPTSLRGY
ncbi:MAG: TIGR03667 family PPOX class F420-dependent oxidoreductase [Chloroflexota bacterium]|nr:TIGR03667 family PPOX class F420-dependent oxidoreductase [Chloroflexota bacterium]